MADDKVMLDEIREAARQVRETSRRRPRIAEIRGRRHAIYRLLGDMGSMVEDDGTPTVLRLGLGVAVVYDESAMDGVVEMLDGDGGVVKTLVAEGDRWLVINTEELHDA